MRSLFRPTRPALLADPAPAAPAPAPASPFGGGGSGWAPPFERGGVGIADPLAAKLPARAAQKYRGIIASAEDASTLSSNLHARHRALIDGRNQALRNLENARSPRGRSGLEPTSPSTLEHLQRELDDINAAIADNVSRRARIAISPLAQNLRDYLRGIAGPIAEHDERVELPAAAKGASWPDRVDAVRQRIAVLHADLHETESSCLPSALVKTRLRAQIAALARPPSVLASVEIGRDIGFAERPLTIQTSGASGPGIGVGSVVDTVGLIAWLFQAELVEALDREVDLLADDANALDPAARAAKEKSILDSILSVERAEEAIIEAAEADGIQIARRPDADVRAILHLSSSLPAPASTGRR